MEEFVEQYKERTPESGRLFQEAQKVMAGGVSHAVRYFPPYPLYIRKAEGPRIWDVDGNEYIDLWMAHFALILGHRPAIVNRALQEVIELGTHWGIVHEYQISLARLISEVVPCAERVRFCVSGTEATMYAVRLARGFTGRNVIIKMEGGWHGGNTDLSSAIRYPYDVPDSAGIPQEMMRYTRAIPFNNVERALEAIHECREDLAGIIVEPVMGAAGLLPAEKEFLEALREETARLGAILIFDEVITGFRLALGGAQEYYGIVPDIVTLGKIAGGGSNIGVLAGRADVFDLSNPLILRKKGEMVLTGGGTFSNTPLSMVPGLAVLGHLRENAGKIYPRLDALGKRLRNGLEKAFEKAGVRAGTVGVGSLCGACFPEEGLDRVRDARDMQTRTDIRLLDHEFKLRMLNQGVYIMHGGGALSTAHTEEDVDRVVRAAEIVAGEMAAARGV